MGDDAKQLAAPAPIESAADLRALMARIDKGKAQPGDMEQLRRLIAADGGRDLAALGERKHGRQLIDATPATPTARAVMRAEVERLQEACGYSRAAGVERALIEHIGLCWLRLQLAESALTHATAGQHTLNEGRYREARLSEAQTRYLRAVALLERLRRYAPPVQINIANQQVVRNE